MRSGSALSSSAVRWLAEPVLGDVATTRPTRPTGSPSARVLDVASGTGTLATALRALGLRVFCVDAERDKVLALREEHGDLALQGRADRLPFAAGLFDLVTLGDVVTRLDLDTVVPELARVLRPGSEIATTVTVRDDSVPWVRRFAEVVRGFDDSAMHGDYGQSALDRLEAHPLTTDPIRRDFRHWVPVTADQLVAMVERRPAVQRLDEQRRRDGLQAVRAVHADLARPGDPLRLPFRTLCLRVVVLEPEPEIIGAVPSAVEISLDW